MIVAPQCERIQCYGAVHLEVVKMMNFTLCAFHHNRKELMHLQCVQCQLALSRRLCDDEDDNDNDGYQYYLFYIFVHEPGVMLHKLGLPFCLHMTKIIISQERNRSLALSLIYLPDSSEH